MPQSLASILVHCIWSTKDRQPFIRPEIEKEFIKMDQNQRRALWEFLLAEWLCGTGNRTIECRGFETIYCQSEGTPSPENISGRVY